MLFRTALRVHLAVAFLAAPLAAQTQNTVLFPRFGISAGGYLSDYGTKVRVDPHVEGLQGTTIDLEKDLGLASSKTLTRAGLEWRPFQRHEIEVAYYSTQRRGELNIRKQIVYEDTTYPIAADVHSRFDIDYWDFSYTYWAHQTDSDGIGVNIGVFGMEFNGELTASAAGITKTLQQDVKATVPLPLIGIEGRYGFGDHIATSIRGSFLPKVSIRSYQGEAYLARASAEYVFGHSLGIGLAYNYFDLNGSYDKNFRADLGMTVNGAEGFVHLVFGR
ncbi:MAG TPA: hypothetical protein VL284_06970 [Thermoanaerobaculia bacterium]|nr:hypothetical protein [Thermoanaerobaculia bacterium]